jgi:hypothetical protein
MPTQAFAKSFSRMPDYNLKTALSKVGQKPVNFAFYRGEDADQILITSKPPTPKELAGIDAECGKPNKRVMKGVCYWKDNRLTFATKLEPAPAWEMLLVAVLKNRKCGNVFPIVVRQLSANESEEASGEGTAPGSTANVGGGSTTAAEAAAKWAQLKASMLPGIRQALGSSALKESVSRLVGEASGFEKKEDFLNAISKFEELRKMLGGNDTAPPTSSPSSSASGPSASSPKVIRPPKPAKLQAALNKIAPAIKAALKKNPDRKRDILLPVKDFQKQLGQEDFEDARVTLGKIGNLVKSLL